MNALESRILGAEDLENQIFCLVYLKDRGQRHKVPNPVAARLRVDPYALHADPAGGGVVVLRVQPPPGEDHQVVRQEVRVVDRARREAHRADVVGEVDPPLGPGKANVVVVLRESTVSSIYERL